MRRLLAGLVMVAALGCERRMAADELAGVWILTESTRQRLGAAPAKLVLKEDGTFEAQTAPGRVFGDTAAAVDASGNGG